MTTSLGDLIAQKDALERQIREAQAVVKADAVAKVRELMEQHGLTASDLVAPTKTKGGAKPGSKVEPKYRDPSSGATWTGRGLKPRWITAALADGKTLDDFSI